MKKLWIVVGVLFLLLTLNAQLSTVYAQETCLLAYWSFDESSGTVLKDSSGNKINGIINGATHQKGKVGNCLYFNGEDASVEIGHNEKINLEYNMPMTFMIWVNMGDTTPQEGYFEYIFTKTDKSLGEYTGYGITQWTSTLVSFGLCCEMTTGNGVGECNMKPTGTGWHHLAFTYTGDGTSKRLKYYVDGKGVSASKGPNAISGSIKNEESLFLGSLDGTSQFFHGCIDELKIYSGVLTKEEIKAYYEATK